MYKLLCSTKKGSAMPLVLLAVLLLFLIGTGLFTLGLRSRCCAVKTSSEIAARCAADAGLVQGLFELNQQLAVKPWIDSSLPSATDQTLTNCDATYSYKVGSDGFDYFITSVGRSGEATKTVRCALELEGPFDKYAVFAQDEIIFKPGTTIEGALNFPIGEILMVGTNSTGEAAIEARTGVTIDGDIFVGVGGDPDHVINSKWEADITGQTSALTEEYQLPSVTVPKHLAELPSIGEIKNDTTLSSNTKCDSIFLSSTDELNIENDIEIYVDGPIWLNAFSKINVSGNSGTTLVLYVKEEFLCYGSAYVNNMNASPANLIIYGLDECDQIEFNADQDFVGAIYAPNADVKMYNSVDVHGAIIAKSFIQQLAADFYYDETLRNPNPNDGLVRFVVKQWQEE